MPTESDPDLDLEIAHVLLIDIVGYSKLLVNEQIEVLQHLNALVRDTPQFRAADEKGKLMRLPTGDGMALLFFENAETPVRCAVEIAQAARQYPHIGLRMGAHSGPVKEVKDVNERSNFAGAGLNLAQRVLDCGDAGHILLSARLAEDLRSYRRWNQYLQDLGECEVKHGVRLHLFNVCKDGVGNPAIPEKVRCQRTGLERLRRATTRWIAGSPVRKACLVLGGIAVALAIAAGIWFVANRNPFHGVDQRFNNIPEKSIAVLPFASLGIKNDTQFADGIQEAILTNLSKVADLKVISRWSVTRYKPGVDRNTQEIALALRVAYLLDCTIQQSGNRLVVHARLINARTDTNVWGNDYSREFRDFDAVLGIQTEIATQIVSQLEVRLSPQERAAIEDRPTKDSSAHAKYVRAKSLIEGSIFSPRAQEDLMESVRLLTQAISRDPDFFLAYYELAHAHDQLYLRRFDPSPARLGSAESAIQALLRLRPESGETHLALAKHWYWGYRDYDRARQELAPAQLALPNDPLPALLTGYIDRREGQWEESINNFNRALDLDPNNAQILYELSLTYYQTRQFPKMAAILDRAVTLSPNDVAMRARRAAVDMDWRADIGPLDSYIQTVAKTDPAGATIIADQWIDLALYKRDATGAARALELLGEAGCNVDYIPFPHSWCEGVAARLRGDEQTAREAFAKVRTEAEKLVREQPQESGPACVLGMANAALGLKEEAIREGERAVALLPISKDALKGPLLVGYLAVIYGWVDEKDRAIEQLEKATSVPSYWSYGSLKLHPYWDPLRDDPRFEKIVESLAPK